MKILEKSKYIIIGIIIGLGFMGIGVYASTNGGGTIGSLFERILGEYKLVGTNIKNHSITAEQIKRFTITAEQIKRFTIDSLNIKNKGIEASSLADDININRCGDEELLGGDGNCHNKSWGDTKLSKEEVDKIVSDKGYLNNNEADLKFLKINGDTIKKSGSLKIGNSASNSARQGNMIKIGDGSYIKIGEWEKDDRLSIYARYGVNITGDGLYINGVQVSNGTAGVSYCSSSTVGRYSLSKNGILRKCIRISADTKTVDSGRKEGRYYYNSARYNCADYSKFGVHCPSGYYGTGGYCRFKRHRPILRSVRHYGKVEKYCKRDASYFFQVQ